MKVCYNTFFSDTLIELENSKLHSEFFEQLGSIIDNELSCTLRKARNAVFNR